jgi:enediyne biosynthesis protein E4
MASPRHPSPLRALLLLTVAASAAGAVGPDPARYQEVRVNDRLLVYFQQRMIGEAIVEKDYDLYQVDAGTGEPLAHRAHWRDGLPDLLPPLGISRAAAEALAPGEVLDTRLTYISPESDVFPIRPAPEGPCWVVRRVEDGVLAIDVIDALTGRRLGAGIAPPYTGFALTGPISFSPCADSWSAWMTNAAGWFQSMGYPTEQVVWPIKTQIESVVASTEVALFYELAHGASSYFSNGCPSAGGAETYASDIQEWILPYEKMPFAFIGSCDGLCAVGGGSFAYEFRKGSPERTTVVGYCGMSTTECADCWSYSIEWQTSLFHYMSLGRPVKQAFDLACADIPACAGPQCVRFSGDEGFAVVPLAARGAPVWSDATGGPLGDEGYAQGAAWSDYDRDGDADLYLTNTWTSNRLLRNDGAGLFTDVTAGPLGYVGASKAAVWGDYDNDGDRDLYLVVNGSPNKLLRDDGGVFVDATHGPLGDAGPGTAAAWGDYDNDGDLDLYLVNFGVANRLFRNDGGTFVDATSGPLGDARNGNSAAWGDYDRDGHLDLFLGNYGGGNALLHNEGDGVFTDATSGPLGDANYTTAVAWVDVDNDEDPDLYLANFGQPNRLLRNDGGHFIDVASGLLAWNGPTNGIAWEDYDLDGDVDLYMANRSGVNYLLRNDGGTFADATSGPLAYTGYSTATAAADYDRDGDPDLYLANADGPNLLLRNGSAGGRHWLQVELTGSDANRDGIGARVRVVTGMRRQVREISGGAGFLSQSDPIARFGLGQALRADTLQVIWPGGHVETFTAVAADQELSIVEGSTASVAGGAAGAARRLALACAPNPFGPRTTIDYDLPLAGRARVRLYRVSGALLRTLVDEDGQGAGPHSIVWDGRDDRGRAVGPGVYFCRLEAGGATVSRAICRLR